MWVWAIDASVQRHEGLLGLPLLADRQRIEQLVFQVEGLELKYLVIDRNDRVVVSTSYVVLEERANGAGRFQPAATPARNHVDGPILVDGAALQDGPCSFIGMDVTVPHDVHRVFFVQRD